MVSREQVDAAEEKLNIAFPADYVLAILEIGASISPTRGLLSALDKDEEIDRREVYLHDLSHLFHPDEVVDATHEYRAAGIPSNLIVIATDCMGNVFCFSEADLRTRKDASPVYFWDNDFVETTRLADDFESWIGMYLEVEGNYDSWKDN